MEHTLPQICKAIIYLDQNILSEIAKDRQERWTDLYQRLRLASYLQLLICPFSDIHQDETLVTDGQLGSDIKSLYRDLSSGCQFHSTCDIELAQLLIAIRKYLVVESPQLPDLNDIFKSDPHRWTLDDTVYADLPIRQDVIDQMRKRKLDLQADLDTVANYWQAEANQKFSEDVEREALAYGNSRVGYYRHVEMELKESLNAIRLAATRSALPISGSFNPDAPIGRQPEVMQVHWLACEVLKAQPEVSDPVAIVEDFFRSSEAKSVPFNFITNRLWAGVAQCARMAKPRSPSANDNNDISVIAHYAPYCDVMLVDRFFQSLVTQSNVNISNHFKTKFFSAKSLGEFMAYLDELIQNIPLAHRKALKAVVPNFPIYRY